MYGVYLSTKIKAEDLKDGSGVLALEPDLYTKEEVKKLKKKDYTLLSYLSVGSIEKERDFYKKYKKYGLKTLEDWPKEVYADVRKAGWQSFLISRAKLLKEKGFDGFWCDNIDVYSEYKSKEMFTAIKEVLKHIRAVGGYVMINGGSEWLDDSFDKNQKVGRYVGGYTQEEVFTRIKDYSGAGTFGKQTKDDSQYYKEILKRAKSHGIGCYLLEYTKDKKLKSTIKAWCKKNGFAYCISNDVNL